jgi:class IIb bacteriocin, lactobin A/cerein 7B family
MKTLNQYELEKVSGGIAPLAVLGAVAAGLAVADAAWSLGKGIGRGWNSY